MLGAKKIPDVQAIKPSKLLDLLLAQLPTCKSESLMKPLARL